MIPAIMSGLKKAGKEKQAEEVAQQGQESEVEAREPQNMQGANYAQAAESIPEPEQAGGSADEEIGAIDMSALKTALTEVSKIGLEAAAQLSQKKHQKNQD